MYVQLDLLPVVVPVPYYSLVDLVQLYSCMYIGPFFANLHSKVRVPGYVPRYMDVPRSKAKVGVPGYVRCKRSARPFTSDVPRYIVWGNTRARYIL